MDLGENDVQLLTDGEIAELNEAADRGQQRSDELRARLAEQPAVPRAEQPTASRVGEFVAETSDRNAGAPPPGEALVRAAKAGDPRAREELIGRLVPLVVAVARSFRANDLDFADLVQEGCVGLLRALERYDPDRGVPFAAYAVPWIRTASSGCGPSPCARCACRGRRSASSRG